MNHDNIPESYQTEYNFRNNTTEEEEDNFIYDTSDLIYVDEHKASGKLEIKRCENPLCKKILHKADWGEKLFYRRFDKFCDVICKQEDAMFKLRMKMVHGE